MPEIVQTVHGSVLTFRAIPASKQVRVVIRRDELRVYVSQPAEKGQANQAILRLLAKSFGFSRSKLELVSGHTDRRKRVLFHGVPVRELQSRIGRLA